MFYSEFEFSYKMKNTKRFIFFQPTCSTSRAHRGVDSLGNTAITLKIKIKNAL